MTPFCSSSAPHFPFFFFFGWPLATKILLSCPYPNQVPLALPHVRFFFGVLVSFYCIYFILRLRWTEKFYVEPV